MHQIRATAGASPAITCVRPPTAVGARKSNPNNRALAQQTAGTRGAGTTTNLQRQAWEWALANRTEDGALPSGKAIGIRFGCHKRWGRLVKMHGLGGQPDAPMQRAA